MKLCIVSSGDFFSDYGGGQVYVRNIVDEFCCRQDITTIVVSYSKDNISEIRKYKCIDVFLVNDEQSLRKILLKTNPDIVHANGEKLITSRTCKQLNIPCIVTAHHGGLVCPAGALLNTNDEICSIPADYSHCLKCYLRNTPTGLFWYPLLKKYSQKHYCRIGERLEKMPSIPFLTPIGRTGQIVTKKIKNWKELAATATHFIAPSNAISDALVRNGCPQSKITVIPHGIPYVHSTSSSQFSVLSSQFINFYYVGRINYVKGIHVLLKSFTSLNNPNIRLHLIGGAGNDSELHYMRRLQKQYKQDCRIIWHGKIPAEQMQDAINDFHCLVHPTICLEIFGLDIAEALAQNKYVIATRCGGAEMQIHDENSGILVSPNDADSLGKALSRYIDSPRVSESTVECITSHINKLFTLYSEILSINKS